MTDRIQPAPLTDEQLNEYAEAHPGDWYSGEWRSEYVEATGDDESEAAYYRVFHVASGAELATLPDWAGPIALFIADAHDAVPALLAEVRRLRDEAAPFTDSERTMLAYALDEAQEHIWSRDGFTDEDQAAVDSLRARLNAPTRPVPAPEAPAPHNTAETAVSGRTGGAAGGWGWCGHDDYHDPHEWADKPGTWCPGHSVAEDGDNR
ncbi:hypothetical protein AB0C88_37765 [Streptomyces chartreusis]|uniref:hypothetical protein n=1 Tax=Streptomyces chartreusis TaxID=1969 RepID=UPI003410EC22